MPTVAELTEPYENFMLGPRAGPDVCEVCFNFTRGYRHCYACGRVAQSIDAVAPISYSIGHEQLHHALAAYKRVGGEVARQLSMQLAAVLWRYLAAHERCLARAAGAASFELVATVPSGDRERDETHPLRWIVDELVGPTRHRHERLLRRTETAVGARAFDPRKYVAARALNGRSVLLLDDTWTTGANAQSAAAALKAADSGPVAVVVIGRHLNREWHENDRRLRGISSPFDWGSCALCAQPAPASALVD
jgi:predicted amidophosphoribosyltransferase